MASYCRPTAPPDADLLPSLPTHGPDLATIAVRATRNGHQPPATTSAAPSPAPRRRIP
jgi:hypothetical protein